jgi:putative Holliday junction resolvase
MSTNIKQILAVDYGLSKIGLAIANCENRVAFTYDTLKNDSNFWKNLSEIILKEDIELIIIGISQHTEFKKVELRAREFGQIIKEKFPEIKVEYQNEMFTTKMAQANLIEKGVKKIKNADDQEAARIILQSWLDRS